MRANNIKEITLFEAHLGKPKRGKMEDRGLPSLHLSPGNLWETAAIVPIDSQHRAELTSAI